eukprot:8043417-Pyramimonas_sp.AAC.1
MLPATSPMSFSFGTRQVILEEADVERNLVLCGGEGESCKRGPGSLRDVQTDAGVGRGQTGFSIGVNG